MAMRKRAECQKRSSLTWIRQEMPLRLTCLENLFNRTYRHQKPLWFHEAVSVSGTAAVAETKHTSNVIDIYIE
jgi:hypothetical protein